MNLLQRRCSATTEWLGWKHTAKTARSAKAQLEVANRFARKGLHYCEAKLASSDLHRHPLLKAGVGIKSDPASFGRAGKLLSPPRILNSEFSFKLRPHGAETAAILPEVSRRSARKTAERAARELGLPVSPSGGANRPTSVDAHQGTLVQ